MGGFAVFERTYFENVNEMNDLFEEKLKYRCYTENTFGSTLVMSGKA